MTALLSEVVQEVIFPNRSIGEIEIEDTKKNINIFDIFNESKELDSDIPNDTDTAETTNLKVFGILKVNL